MIKEYLLKKLLDGTVEVAKRTLKESRGRLAVTRDDIESSIVHHLRSVKNWSKAVSFNDLKQAKRTTDIFIDLDLFVYPRRVRIQTREPIQSIPLKKIFEYSKGHVILLGQPGAGKTTSMKYLCQALFTDQDLQAEGLAFPILIKFRDLNSIVSNPDTALLIDQIYNILGLKIEFMSTSENKPSADRKLADEKNPFSDDERKALKEKLVISILGCVDITT